MYQENSRSGLVAGLVVGIAAGLVIGLMLAPVPGGETRNMLRQGVTTGLERIRQLREDGH